MPPCRNQDGEEFFKEWTESSDSFDQMGLHDSLLRGIYAYGAKLLTLYCQLVSAPWRLHKQLM